MARDLTRAPLVFAFPEGSDAPSGGNIYNRELTKALAEIASVSVTSFAEARTLLESKRPGVYFFDTLNLEETLPLAPPDADQSIALLVHHLPSLEPGVAADDASLAWESAALRRFDVFVATSVFTRDLLTSRGLAESAILTVPPALPKLSTTPREYDAPLSALLVANLIPRKGVLSLLEALEAEGPAPRRYTLRIVGRDDIDPAYAEACRRAIRASSHLYEFVFVEPAVPYEAMGEFYETSQLLVSAATLETYGMAIYEARAHGLAVLARDGGYVRHHFTHGENGLSFASTTELARTLTELAADEPRMKELFARAQATRPRLDYGWAEAAKRFMSELARVSV